MALNRTPKNEETPTQKENICHKKLRHGVENSWSVLGTASCSELPESL